MDATWKKEARTTKDNMAKDSNGRATRDGALVGRGPGRSKGQDPVGEHCRCPTGDEEDKQVMDTVQTWGGYTRRI